MSRAPARAARLLAAGLALVPAWATTLAAPGAAASPAGQPTGAPAWRRDFEAVCARTQDAMSLTDAELRDLVARADRLRPALEQLDPSERKVYLRWLERCRALYQFVLDGRAAGAP